MTVEAVTFDRVNSLEDLQKLLRDVEHEHGDVQIGRGGSGMSLLPVLSEHDDGEVRLYL